MIRGAKKEYNLDEDYEWQSSVGCTMVGQVDKYDEWEVNELIDWVYKAKSEDDAVANIKTILKEYEARKSFWQKLKALLLT